MRSRPHIFIRREQETNVSDDLKRGTDAVYAKLESASNVCAESSVSRSLSWRFKGPPLKIVERLVLQMCFTHIITWIWNSSLSLEFFYDNEEFIFIRIHIPPSMYEMSRRVENQLHPGRDLLSSGAALLE